VLPIDDFHADGMDFLSNFHLVHVRGWAIDYPSAEHAYVACKCSHRDDQEFVATLSTPGQAKRFGRGKEVQGRVMRRLRPDFDEKKLGWMRQIIQRKFAHPHLMEKLQATGDRQIIEGNKWCDQFWGDCRCSKHLMIPGENHLGRLLMEIRDQ